MFQFPLSLSSQGRTPFDIFWCSKMKTRNVDQTRLRDSLVLLSEASQSKALPEISDRPWQSRPSFGHRDFFIRFWASLKHYWHSLASVYRNCDAWIEIMLVYSKLVWSLKETTRYRNVFLYSQINGHVDSKKQKLNLCAWQGLLYYPAARILNYDLSETAVMHVHQA